MRGEYATIATLPRSKTNFAGRYVDGDAEIGARFDPYRRDSGTSFAVICFWPDSRNRRWDRRL